MARGCGECGQRAAGPAAAGQSGPVSLSPPPGFAVGCCERGGSGALTDGGRVLLGSFVRGEGGAGPLCRQRSGRGPGAV